METPEPAPLLAPQSSVAVAGPAPLVEELSQDMPGSADEAAAGETSEKEGDLGYSYGDDISPVASIPDEESFEQNAFDGDDSLELP